MRDLRSGLMATAGALAALLLARPAHADLDAAKALVAKHRAMPAFTAPGEPFDAKQCMADKSMFVIPLSSANPFNVAIGTAMQSAAKMVGFRMTVLENQAKMDQWVQGMSSAVAQHYSLIDLMGGIPPAALGPQIKEARDKGVKVTTTHLYDVTQDIPGSIDASIRTNYTEAGKIMAAWAIEHTGGHANTVIIGSDEVVPTKPFVKAIEDYLTANCKDCKFQYINVPFPEWGTKIQPGVQSAVIADPSINYILPIYDNMAQFVVPALRITNRTDKVKIATYNGSPGMLDLLRQGAIEMDVGESLGWVGMAGVDASMRLLCGKGKITDSNAPLLIFDKDNIATAGTPANYDKGYGDVHVAGFRTLWELK